MGIVARMLPHVVDGSASPMETALIMLLCLPGRLGGFGLPKPEVNRPLPLPDEARLASGHAHCVPDLLWPEQRVAVEYDGADYHSSEGQVTRDLRRRNILATLGLSVIVVRKEQVQDYLEFEHLARSIARLLGARVRPRVANWGERHEELRREALGRHF